MLDFENHEPARRIGHLSRDLTHPNALGYELAGDRAFETLVTAGRNGLPAAR